MGEQRNGLIIVTVILGVVAIVLSSLADRRAQQAGAQPPPAIPRADVKRPIANQPIAAQQSGHAIPAGRSSVFTFTGVPSSHPPTDAPDILNRSFSISADVDVPEGGGSGMIVTDGGRTGGYGLYVRKGKPVFTYNFLDRERFKWEARSALSRGQHTIVFEFAYDGGGRGQGGEGVLRVDGQTVATQRIRHTVPFVLAPDETFDVGLDARTPVDNDYQTPFRFIGTITKLTIMVGSEQIAAGEVVPQKK